jgi:RNA polymerase sigma factor (sigma-70 family)
LNAPVLKTGRGLAPSRVRIPSSPLAKAGRPAASRLAPAVRNVRGCATHLGRPSRPNGISDPSRMRTLPHRLRRPEGLRPPALRSRAVRIGPPLARLPLSSDRPILMRVAAGEVGAANECIRHFRGLVWSLARKLCPSPTEAEDAVQEIFIDIWRSAGRFDPSIASETTFVALIARRRLIDRSRRRKRRPEQLVSPEALGAVTDDHVTDDDQARSDARDAASLAQAALSQLRPEQRRVLHLSIRQGQSHEQIATTTGLPLGTVKTHARRGLIKLRELLAAQGFDLDAAGLRSAAPPSGDRGSTTGPSNASPRVEGSGGSPTAAARPLRSGLLSQPPAKPTPDPPAIPDSS